uniref:hypothetical protein n=1 Tax=Altererythrobacter segetis TaxID=1104773 RepID=UPI001408BDC3|nr:hypothetical protein [Altererythrobacter segetis]
MILNEEQLGVILQASIDRASERLAQSGGFLPFGARALPNGDVEFLEADEAGGDEPLDALYRRIGALLAEDARRHEILASTLVANARLPAGFDKEFETAISVLVEAQDFCRSVVVPYRTAPDGVVLGKMIPEEAEPAVFA